MELAKWLNAKYYQSKYEPIPIEEYLVYENDIYQTPTSSSLYRTTSQLRESQRTQSTVAACRKIEPSEFPELSKPTTNAVVSLAIETARAGYGALVFCCSRAGCQTMASLIAQAMPDVHELGQGALDRRIGVLSSLRNLMMLPLDETLERTVIQGVAFHRTSKERGTP